MLAFPAIALIISQLASNYRHQQEALKKAQLRASILLDAKGAQRL